MKGSVGGRRGGRRRRGAVTAKFVIADCRERETNAENVARRHVTPTVFGEEFRWDRNLDEGFVDDVAEVEGRVGNEDHVLDFAEAQLGVAVQETSDLK